MGIAHNILLYYNKRTDLWEFNKISKYFKRSHGESGNIKVLDIGSGLCAFGDHFAPQFERAEIFCLDINNELAELATAKGHKGICGNILNLPFEDNSFDIVHCSHVIEHIDYPGITTALQELMRVVNSSGVVIIRSPLVANFRFYDDIDHVRPYPPASILNFFGNKQQQKIGTYNICEIERWYTRIAVEINKYSYGYNRYSNKLIAMLNLIFKLAWLSMGIPKARPNNYGLVLKKDQYPEP